MHQWAVAGKKNQQAIQPAHWPAAGSQKVDEQHHAHAIGVIAADIDARNLLDALAAQKLLGAVTERTLVRLVHDNLVHAQLISLISAFTGHDLQLKSRSLVH